jgi:thiamine transport system ATP-binding protein
VLALESVVIVQDDFRLEADLEVREGARVAVLGPSGSGKSTLLGAIAGFISLAGGRITWNGSDLAALPPGGRPLSILFQDNNLFPHLTAAQNVGLALHPGLRLTRDDHARVEAALARVGLAGLGARRPAQLSGGQQGRVALARVLLGGRPLLLLDEPFAALGPALKGEMLTLVAEIAGETNATLLMVTHEPRDAQAIAEEVIVVDDGRAEAPMPTEALFADPPPGLKAYLG